MYVIPMGLSVFTTAPLPLPGVPEGSVLSPVVALLLLLQLPTENRFNAEHAVFYTDNITG